MCFVLDFCLLHNMLPDFVLIRYGIVALLSGRAPARILVQKNGDVESFETV